MATRALKVAEVPKCGLGLVKVVWPFKNGYRLRVSNATGFPFIQMMRAIQRDTKAAQTPYLRLWSLKRFYLSLWLFKQLLSYNLPARGKS